MHWAGNCAPPARREPRRQRAWQRACRHQCGGRRSSGASCAARSRRSPEAHRHLEASLRPPGSRHPSSSASSSAACARTVMGVEFTCSHPATAQEHQVPSARRLRAFGCNQIPHCSNSTPIPMPEARFPDRFQPYSSAAIPRIPSGRVPKVGMCTAPSELAGRSIRKRSIATLLRLRNRGGSDRKGNDETSTAATHPVCGSHSTSCAAAARTSIIWKALAKVLGQFHLQFHREDRYSRVASAQCRGDRARARAKLNQVLCPHGSPSRSHRLGDSTMAG